MTIYPLFPLYGGSDRLDDVYEASMMLAVHVVHYMDDLSDADVRQLADNLSLMPTAIVLAFIRRLTDATASWILQRTREIEDAARKSDGLVFDVRGPVKRWGELRLARLNTRLCKETSFVAALRAIHTEKCALLATHVAKSDQPQIEGTA